MRYRLRTLLIVLALVPPIVAGVWFVASEYFRKPRPPTREELNRQFEEFSRQEGTNT